MAVNKAQLVVLLACVEHLEVKNSQFFTVSDMIALSTCFDAKISRSGDFVPTTTVTTMTDGQTNHFTPLYMHMG